MKDSIESLQKAILDPHGCKSTWVESVPVKEVFRGQTVWEGVVQVFDLIDHPTTKRCYAWSHELDGSKKRKFFAVLHQGIVNSPEKAVKVAIVNEVRKWTTSSGSSSNAKMTHADSWVTGLPDDSAIGGTIRSPYALWSNMLSNCCGVSIVRMADGWINKEG